MYGVFRTINIGGSDIVAPNGFTPAREQVYAGEYTTMTGKTIADLIGWKYSDMELAWDYLPQSMLNILLNISGETQITFTDIDGSHTETVIPTSSVAVGTRMTRGTQSVWKDVSLSIKFIHTHRS